MIVTHRNFFRRIHHVRFCTKIPIHFNLIWILENHTFFFAQSNNLWVVQYQRWHVILILRLNQRGHEEKVDVELWFRLNDWLHDRYDLVRPWRSRHLCLPWCSTSVSFWYDLAHGPIACQFTLVFFSKPTCNPPTIHTQTDTWMAESSRHLV